MVLSRKNGPGNSPVAQHPATGEKIKILPWISDPGNLRGAFWHIPVC